MPDGVTMATTGGVFLEARGFFSFTGGATTGTILIVSAGVWTTVGGAEAVGGIVVATAFLPRPRELILVG